MPGGSTSTPQEHPPPRRLRRAPQVRRRSQRACERTGQRFRSARQAGSGCGSPRGIRPATARWASRSSSRARRQRRRRKRS